MFALLLLLFLTKSCLDGV